MEVANDPIIIQQEKHWYYVQRPWSLVEEVVNIVETTQHEDDPTLVNFTQEAMQLHNSLALPCLLARPTQGRKPLVDYSRLHVVNSIKYLIILHKKPIDKTTSKEHKKAKWKEREENKTRKTTEVVVVTQPVANRHVKAQFDATWIIVLIKNVGGSFHKNSKWGGVHTYWDTKVWTSYSQQKHNGLLDM